MTKIGANTNLSDYNSRIVAIIVRGLPRQDLSNKSAHTPKVPYYHLSKTIQRISPMGGTIVKVAMLSPTFVVGDSGQTSPKSQVVYPIISTNDNPSVKDKEEVTRESKTIQKSRRRKSKIKRMTKRGKISRNNQRIQGRKSRIKARI
ncbi:MAG: hypothetical protein F6K10_12245 [Moorea sp. SIO2B7]|nr:hypothetical protein [Moorena sp. SIO2B7]